MVSGTKCDTVGQVFALQESKNAVFLPEITHP